MKQTVIVKLATLVDAYHRCVETDNKDWEGKHLDAIQELEQIHLPSGSGFDSGTSVDLDASTADRIVLHTSYHHMNEDGYYCGWTDHKITIRPAFIGAINLRIGGRDYQGFKDYAYDVFYSALLAVVD